MSHRKVEHLKQGKYVSNNLDAFGILTNKKAGAELCQAQSSAKLRTQLSLEFYYAHF